MRKKYIAKGFFLFFIFALLPAVNLFFFFGKDVDKKYSKSNILEELVLWKCVLEAASRETEARKAESVIIRTNLCHEFLQGKEICEIAKEIRKEAWKKGIYFCAGKEEKRWKQEISDTEGQILQWRDWPREIPVHLCSGGRTRDGRESLGEEYAYLTSVESPHDREAETYLTTISESSRLLPEEMEILERDTAGYVKIILVNGRKIAGEEFRQRFSLPSGMFFVHKKENHRMLLCQGEGHGLGYSLYGGEALAKEGKDYQQILKWYFPKMELGKQF